MHNGGLRISIAKLKAIQMREDPERIRQRKIFKERQEALKRAMLSDLSETCREAIEAERQQPRTANLRRDDFESELFDELGLKSEDKSGYWLAALDASAEEAYRESEVAKRERKRQEHLRREMEGRISVPSTKSRGSGLVDSLESLLLSLADKEVQRLLWIICPIAILSILFVISAIFPAEEKTMEQKIREENRRMDRIARQRQEEFDQARIDRYIEIRTSPLRTP